LQNNYFSNAKIIILGASFFRTEVGRGGRSRQRRRDIEAKKFLTLSLRESTAMSPTQSTHRESPGISVRNVFGKILFQNKGFKKIINSTKNYLGSKIKVIIRAFKSFE